MIKIQNINDASYKRFGKVVKDIDLSDLIAAMEAPHAQTMWSMWHQRQHLRQPRAQRSFRKFYYGKLPIQVGYCNGHNSLLNALEYHRCGEVNVAVTDLIVLVGSLVDVADDFYL